MPSATLKTPSGNKSGKRSEKGNLVIATTDTVPNPPESLTVTGKARWKQISTILVNRKAWSLDWIPALEHLCRQYDHLADIDEALMTPGEFMLVPSTNGRSIKSNPLLDLRLKIEAFIQSQLLAFGLTPMSAKGVFTQEVTTSQSTADSARDLSDDPFGESEEDY